MPENISIQGLLREHLELAWTLRRLEIHFNPEICNGVWQCYEVCPIGCWEQNQDERVAIFHSGELCIACGACALQCPEGAIELKVRHA